MKLLYTLMLLLVVEAAVARITLYEPTTGPVFRTHVNDLAAYPLSAPIFVPRDDQTVHQTNIRLLINRANDGSATEVYRSTAEAGPYQLIHTEAPGASEFLYVDQDLKPRTTFYYRARSVKDGETPSAFSEIFSAMTASRFYPPVLEATANEDSSVEIFFQDISYQDNYYTISRTDLDGGNELVIRTDLFLTDSGRVEIFADNPDPNATYIYHVAAEVRDEGFPTYYSVSTDTLFVPPYVTLETPYFDFSHAPADMPCGNETAFNYANDNDGAFTEIYRSRAEDGPYELIATEEFQYGSYKDRNLGSRKTYYYKLRAVRAHEVSPFSEPVALQTEGQYFDPVLEVSATGSAAEVKLEDRSYLDGSYELYAVERESTIVTFNQTAVLPDSGQVVTYTDTNVLPGKTYIYYVNVLLACEGHPYLSNVAIDTVQIPDGPAVTGFTLVDPYTDQDVRALSDGDTFGAAGRYNIRADVNGTTVHVEFFLNSKRSYDSKAPFALFGNNKNNYHAGKLKPGDYILTATAYGMKNNGRREKGNTLQFAFTVTADAPEHLIAIPSQEIVSVDVFPNPVVNIATVVLSGNPGTGAHVRLVDASGNTLRSESGMVDSHGQFSQELPVHDLPKGTYYLMIKTEEGDFTRRIVIR